MSWWISLHDKEGKIPEVESFEEGGTYILGCSTEADLNVIYNCGKHFDFDSLHGKKAGDTIPELEAAVTRLGTKQHADYWQPTEGNKALVPFPATQSSFDVEAAF